MDTKTQIKKIYVIVHKSQNRRVLDDKMEEFGFFESLEDAENFILRLDDDVNNYNIRVLNIAKAIEDTDAILNVKAYKFRFQDNTIDYDGYKYCKIKDLELILSPSPNFYAEVLLDPKVYTLEEAQIKARQIFYDNIIISEYYTVNMGLSDGKTYIDKLDINNENSWYYNRIYNNGVLVALLDTNDFSILIPTFEADDESLAKHHAKVIADNDAIFQEVRMIKEMNRKHTEQYS
jgi:hypothetical protein